MEVPFLDLKRGYAKYGQEIENEVVNVLRSGVYLNGPYTKELERRLASFLDIFYGIGVSSGTEGLYLILKALDLPRGSYVLVPAFTFIATSEVVVRAGFIPFFVDVEERTYNVSLEKLKEAYAFLTKRGKKPSAVIVVSLYGIPADLERIEEFCQENGIILIEDICQAFGAKILDRAVGTFGLASATSFYPTKPLATFGDAGMVFTSDEEIEKRVRILKEHGQTRPYFYEYHGINGRIDEIHSAILLVKFKYFKQELELRRNLASYYIERLKGLEPNLFLPEIPKTYFPSWALFTITTPYRDQLQAFLKEKKIYTRIYYEHPLHLQPVYQELGFKDGMLPVTEKLSKQVLSLPFFPYLTREELEYVVHSIKEFFQRG
ncbi:DegT/DnrJ/EryC1/StrS family aminotransferase [Thermodesulfobacterium sp. TA1]|uniref:DegT/DnrJ/EryC1/StrS family aminotransferase n=1 Tax=Thermodesulfobacterium sp. TA1 TaxID=2234087 RepID=UPI001231EEC5|nr:DegT/DnrJ/EryC1/StrS family aminotransferase [Thermodesulfobacterium sp. TA1]QER42027.1 DegT/DnrJ/EryC1/StrS family aminotransferase [Thermodesulfobacterium sp. TA1]